MKLLDILFEIKTSELYGSNYLYRLKPYIEASVGDLPQYGVSFSEFNKWGINPVTGYFPKGVYFYFLHPKCEEYGATGTGFAADRPWANVAELNLEKFAILNPGGLNNFGATELANALENLKAKYGDLVPAEDMTKQTFDSRYSSTMPEWIGLVNILTTMESSGAGGFNKLLHVAGYDGILDVGGVFLPIEGCQGVQTWPGAAEYIESIPTPKSVGKTIPKMQERFKNVFARIKSERDGGLVLTEQEFVDILGMIPDDLHKWDRQGFRMDLLGWLFRKVNFKHNGFYKQRAVLRELTNHGEELFSELEFNPTTPREFWEALKNSSFEDARLAAIDMLKK